jgi:hypothetical protein
MLTMVKVFLSKALANLLATAVGNVGALNGVKVGLYTNTPYIWTENSKLADLTEAAYTGYLQQAVTWLSSWINPNGMAEVAGDTLIFEPSALLLAPVTIIGYFIVDSTGLILLGGDNLPTPIILQQTTDAVPIVPDFTLGDQT